jgi:hypothetical protein
VSKSWGTKIGRDIQNSEKFEWSPDPSFEWHPGAMAVKDLTKRRQRGKSLFVRLRDAIKKLRRAKTF